MLEFTLIVNNTKVRTFEITRVGTDDPAPGTHRYVWHSYTHDTAPTQPSARTDAGGQFHHPENQGIESLAEYTLTAYLAGQTGGLR